jgi:hypothetical protein
MMRFQLPPRPESLNHTPIPYVNNLSAKLIDGKHLQTNVLFWLGFVCDNLVHPYNTLPQPAIRERHANAAGVLISADAHPR